MPFPDTSEASFRLPSLCSKHQLSFRLSPGSRSTDRCPSETRSPAGRPSHPVLSCRFWAVPDRRSLFAAHPQSPCRRIPASPRLLPAFCFCQLFQPSPAASTITLSNFKNVSSPIRRLISTNNDACLRLFLLILLQSRKIL